MRPTKLPLNWCVARLGDLVDSLQYGFTASAMREAVGPRFLRITDLKDGCVDWDSVPFCYATGDELERYRLRDGDLVFARSGSIEKAWRVTCVPDAVFASYLIRGSPPSELVGMWLETYVKSPSYLSQIRRAAAGTGMSNVNATKLASIEVPLAPEMSMRSVVRAVEALTVHSKKAKESLDRIPALLEKLKRSILAAAFRGDLTKDWREAHPDVEPADVLLARIRAERRRRWEEAEFARLTARGKVPVDDRWKDPYQADEQLDASDLADLPSSWCWARWNQVGTSQNGRAFPSADYAGEGIKLLRPGNLHVSGEIEWSDANTRRMPDNYSTKHPDYIVAGNELVMNLTAQSLKDEFLGRVCLTGADERCLLNQRIARFKPTLIPPRFFLWLFKSPRFRAFVDELNTGSLIQHIFTTQIDAFVFPLPPEPEGKVLVERIDAWFSILNRLEATLLAQRGRLPKLDASILAKAFRGELVPQDPADEPASALLERIRATREATSASDDTPLKRPRTRRAAAAAPTPPATPSDDRGLAPTPNIRAVNPTSFIDLPRADQLPLVHAALRGVGPLPADAAVRLIADHLRERHLAEFSRLRSDGPLYAAIEKALDAAVRAELLDRPQRGHLRALVPDPKDYTDADWRRCLEGALADRAESDQEPDEDALIRAAAEWAVVNMGLVHQRLRSGGLVHQGLSRALRVGVPAAANDARPAQ